MKKSRAITLLALVTVGCVLIAASNRASPATKATIATSGLSIPTKASEQEPPTVLVMTISDTINPVTAAYLKRGMDEAQTRGAECVVVMLDTPGGGLDPTKDIVKYILASEVPVVVFVAPQGAHAASAGSIIVLASHVAAMSPGTNMGAAHPVAGGGEKMDETMAKKVENDLAAYARSLAEKRGRDLKWAEDSVRESVSITESEALKGNMIDLVANDLSDLMDKLDGRKITLDTGKVVVLRTKNAVAERFEPSWRDKVLSTIANPNIAYILLMIGVYGIMFELMNPGAIYPGVIGVICLVVAFFAFQVLPVNYAGLILILIGIALFVVEVKVVSYGMLTVGGLVCLVVGSMMLISEPESGIQISLTFILPVAFFTAALVVFLATLAFKAHRRKPLTGTKGLVGALGAVEKATSAGTFGKVFVEGELWNASSDEPLQPGTPVRVVSVQGLRVKVEKQL
ncbi:MAG: nodulation protein NfeD [Candidatus Coatesbacteria bacterium]|nr:nodulation protein NfeD [Candidatus Coatesbacteria bacterium]